MIKEPIFNANIPIDLKLARRLYKEYLLKHGYNNVYRELVEKLELIWDYKDLNFNPKIGDILASTEDIIMFGKHAENSDESIVALFVYNKADKTIRKIDNYSNLIEVVCGDVDEYVYANNQEREIFFKAMSSLK